MKFRVLLLTLLIGCFAHGQIFIKPSNGYGLEYNRLLPDTLQGIPKDTFAVTGTYKNVPFFAIKNDIPYIWSPSLGKWILWSSNGALTNGYGIAISGTTIKADTTQLTTPWYVRYVRDTSLAKYYTSVQSDALYAPLSHTHIFSQITDGVSAVHNLFSQGAGISYNPATGVISATNGGLLSGLSDVTIVSPAINQVLQYNGTKWTNASISYIQNGTALQTGANFNIDGNGQAAKMLLGTSSFVGTELLHAAGGVQFDGRATSNTIMTTAGVNVTPPTFGTTQGEIHLRVISSTGSSNWPAITVGANDISGAQGGIYFNINSGFGTRLHFATTDNTTTGAQSRMFINETGQVAIASTLFASTEKLRVNGDVYLDGSIRLGNLAADPAGGANGWLYYNTTTNRFRKYNNGAWVDLISASEAILNGTTSQTGSYNISGTATIGGGATIGGAGAGNTSINVGGSGIFSLQESTTATVNTGASSTSGGIMTFERGTNNQGRYSLSYLNANTSYTSQLGTASGYAAGTLLFNSTGTQSLFTGQSFGASFVFDNQASGTNPNAISLAYSASGSTITVPVIFKKDGSVVFQKITQTQPAAITSTATTTIDLSTGNIQQINLVANITTLTLNNATPGKYYFQFTQDATGGRTVAWPANFKWAGGTAPTLSAANKTDYIECLYNGTNFLAIASLNY
jgi:hypothetical protein